MPGCCTAFPPCGVILYTLSMGDSHLPRVDRTKLTVSNLHDPQDDLHYWLSKSHSERLEAVEHSRLAVYGYDAATARLHRVLEVAQLSRG